MTREEIKAIALKIKSEREYELMKQDGYHGSAYPTTTWPGYEAADEPAIDRKEDIIGDIGLAGRQQMLIHRLYKELSAAREDSASLRKAVDTLTNRCLKAEADLALVRNSARWGRR